MCLAHTQDTVREHAERDGATISRRGFLLGTAAAGLASVLPAPALSARRRGRRARDLTHVFRQGFPAYGGQAPARKTLGTIEKEGFYQQEWTFAEHSATHMDAPGHFIPGGRLSPQISLRELFPRLAVVDISDRAATDPDAVVGRKDVQDFEKNVEAIASGSAVLMYSGWDKRVGDPNAYRNPGPDGKLHFPGWSAEAVEWLLEKRDITAIGVDTLSLDPGISTTFDVHKILLGADRYGLENLNNLSRIPPAGATAYVGLIPWEEGSGGPCRVVARW